LGDQTTALTALWRDKQLQYTWLPAAQGLHADFRQVTGDAPDSFDFDVTIASPCDTPQRYADAFRAMTKEGRVLGERILRHDHAGEQPFTRDLYGVRIPRTVRVVIIQARNRKHGYGGRTVDDALPGR
jgi:hypothetical protein